MKTIMDIGTWDQGVVLEMDGRGRLFQTDNAVTRERVTEGQRFGPGWDQKNVFAFRAELEAAGWPHEAATLFCRRAFRRARTMKMKTYRVSCDGAGETTVQAASLREARTKTLAFVNLIEAGYSAVLTKSGLDVRGEGWSVHYDDRGQDQNEYIGDVPPKVDEMAVWDDATTRRPRSFAGGTPRKHRAA
jgi:hypothetical protein